MSVADLLKTIPFFHNLTDEQLARLAEVGRAGSYQAEQIVFSEGDSADSLYVILQGVVKVYRYDNICWRDVEAEAAQPQLQSKKIELSTLKRGDFFGEMALFDGAPRSATVATVTACEFFILAREEFILLLSQSQPLLTEVMTGLSSKLRSINERIYQEMLDKERLHTEIERERYRSLAQMVAGVAHEINTPLGIINTATSILTEGLAVESIAALAQDDETKLVLDDIHEAARLIQGNLTRVNRLVQSFKNLSINQITDKKEIINLPFFINEIVSLYRPQARTDSLIIEVLDHLTDVDREWHGYPGYLSQILFNLLSNVERYAYPEGGSGRVELELANQNSNSYLLNLRDFGCGIAAAELPKVFEVFYTTGRHRGGSGLGLAIVYNLVTSALKGSIEINSTPGQGTTVTVLLPRIVPD